MTLARTRAAIGLGSNLGDRLGNLRQAVARLREKGTVLATSTVFETPPFGFTNQPRFLNAALILEIGESPPSILALLKTIEKEMGRKERERWGPREIDLDLLLIPDLVYEDESLKIPHPQIAERAFVLVPLAEIAPSWIHPVLGLEIIVLAERFKAEAATFSRITCL
ncbi:MAG: 2-amino-4-hydroxy-6-hydroxymethyldihydropteridine diphosphokinase [Synergistaceae bacterium]|jgi:2-amino-4-hydroxy-6-hydroxymethyldihydropteridine diphosphokinase|nr:2-amino-4-hydroxy-6-hydroxymethyldihydropteridine diphosphokinase [Synergistaceae bacterium]